MASVTGGQPSSGEAADFANQAGIGHVVQPAAAFDGSSTFALWASQQAAAFNAVGVSNIADLTKEHHEDNMDDLQDNGFSEDFADDGHDDIKRTTKKKSKGGRIASEITREELSECFGMPSEEAARRLGIGLTVLKRICRKFGVPRWPYRKLKSLDRLISNVEAGSPPGDTYKHLMKSADEIREHQRAMCQGVSLDLDDKTKKLQQAYSKFNHKQRKAAREDDDSGGGHYMMTGPNEGSENGVSMMPFQKALQDHNEQQQQQQQQGGGVNSAAANEQQSQAVLNSDQMMYMAIPGMNYLPSVPVMMMDPSAYTSQQIQMASATASASTAAQPAAACQPVQESQAAQPSSTEPEHGQGKAEANTVAPAPADVGKTAEAVAAGNLPRAGSSTLAPAKADVPAAASTAPPANAAWGMYGTVPAAMDPASAYWKAWSQQQQQATGSDEQSNAAAASASAAAAAASYYMHPMAASYMPAMAAAAAAAAGQGYPGAYAYMPGYIGGYDPNAMMQQYYQQMWRSQMPAEASAGTSASDAMTSYMQQQQQQVGGMMPMAPSDMSAMAAAAAAGGMGMGMGMDPSQAAALAAQQASYYAQYMGQQGPWAAMGGMPQMSTMGMDGSYSMVAAGTSDPPMAASQQQQQSAQEDASKEQEGGKRKRKPNVKYEGTEYTKGDELDGGSKPLGGSGGEEPTASVAHTLMHMASGEVAAGGAEAAQQGQQAHAAAAAAYAGMSMAATQQNAGMQQMPNSVGAMQAMQMHPGMMQAAGMMMHPAWAAQMMPGTMHMHQAGMPTAMDMTGGKGMAMDMSSMYYPAMMMQQGYGSYPGMGQ